MSAEGGGQKVRQSGEDGRVGLRHRVRVEVIDRAGCPVNFAVFQSPDPADLRRCLDTFYAGDVRWHLAAPTNSQPASTPARAAPGEENERP